MLDWGGIIGLMLSLVLAGVLVCFLGFLCVLYSAKLLIWVVRRCRLAWRKRKPAGNEADKPTTKVVSINWEGLKRFLGWKGATEDLKRRKLP